MFLSFFPEVYTTFGWTDKNKTDLLFLVFNNEFYGAVTSELSNSYNAETKKWT